MKSASPRDLDLPSNVNTGGGESSDPKFRHNVANAQTEDVDGRPDPSILLEKEIVQRGLLGL